MSLIKQHMEQMMLILVEEVEWLWSMACKLSMVVFQAFLHLNSEIESDKECDKIKKWKHIGGRSGAEL